MENHRIRARPLVMLLCLATLAAILVSEAARAQIRVEVSLVNVFATVRDKKKAIVGGLTQQDFRIYEDGQPQEISNFAAESTLPVTLGLLIDTSGSETDFLAAEQQAASQFLARVLRKNDLAMVVTFDTGVDLLANFTGDRATLDRAIRRAQINTGGSGTIMTPGPFPQITGGGTNFFDAIYLAAHDKLAGEAGRKALVILTDAQDTGSKMSLQNAVDAAQRTDTVIHILLVGMGNQGVAKKLAEETGGRVISVRSQKNLEQAFDQISEELRHQYTIAYSSSNKTRDGGYREIKVETANKDYSVLARRGYYAPRN